MAKNVFRSQEVLNVEDKVIIEAPFEEEAEEVEIQSIEEYTGPTADDLRREAEAFTLRWEEEKAKMIRDAEAQAAEIVKEAEEKAYQEVQARLNEVQKQRRQSEDELMLLKKKTETEAEDLVKSAREQADSIRAEAYKEGFANGREAGFTDGKKEVQRLIDHLHTIINRAVEKRNEIIAESETQVINLVLLIVRKIIKVISENQKNVVINNVIQSLRKLKSRGDVVVRVNLDDVQLTSDHVNDFMRMVENVRSITVLEDSTVDRGGCIIETDFGQIDARITSQLQEIEEKILEIAPIRTRGEK